MLPGDLPLISVNFLYGRENIRQLFMRVEDLPSIFVNFPCDRDTFRQLSTIRASRETSVM